MFHIEVGETKETGIVNCIKHSAYRLSYKQAAFLNKFLSQFIKINKKPSLFHYFFLFYSFMFLAFAMKYRNNPNFRSAHG